MKRYVETEAAREDRRRRAHERGLLLVEQRENFNWAFSLTVDGMCRRRQAHVICRECKSSWSMTLFNPVDPEKLDLGVDDETTMLVACSEHAHFTADGWTEQ